MKVPWIATIAANLLCVALVLVRNRYSTVTVCQTFSAICSVLTYTLYYDDACSRAMYDTYKYTSDGISWLLEFAVIVQAERTETTPANALALWFIVLHLCLKLCCYFALTPFQMPANAAEATLRDYKELLNIVVMFAFVWLTYSDGDAIASEEHHEAQA